MKSLLLFLTALTWLTLSSTPVLACQCAEYGTPVCASYWRAEAVFVGLLRDTTPTSRKAPNTRMLQFIVEEPFRGVSMAPSILKRLPAVVATSVLPKEFVI